jgi:hypothetical protein
MSCSGQRSNQLQGDLNRTPSGRLSLDINKYKMDKIVAGGDGKKKLLTRQYEVLAAH